MFLSLCRSIEIVRLFEKFAICKLFGSFVMAMRVIAKSALKKFWLKHADAEVPLQSWHKLVSEADWKTPAELKEDLKSASVVGNNRVVFNIKGNDYRLVTFIDFKFQ